MPITSSANPWIAIGEDLAAAWRTRGVAVVEAKQKDLSVPVEYVTGPRGGRVVIRSVRGEAPRMETGNLREHVRAEVSHDGDIIRLAIDNPVIYGTYLQNDMERIVFNDVDDRFGPEIIADAARAASGSE